MTVIVGDDCRVYWNYQVWTLPKGTVVPDGEFADYLVAIGAAAQLVADPPAEPKRRTRKTEN